MQEDWSEDDPDGVPDDDAPRPSATGVTAVDTVIDAVASLDRRPLDEHVGVFEQAHEDLRRALEAPAAVRPSAPAPSGA